MFVLSVFKDTVRIPPHVFGKQFNDSIQEALNKKLANKVVHNVGLCISLWDVTDVADSNLLPGDGSTHTGVQFRYLVFRPFVEEIIVGKVKSSSRDGINVTLGFFDDIVIPADSMQHPSRFDEAEQLWVWEYEVDGEKHDLFVEVGEDIRLKVVEERFVDTSPTGPRQSGEVEPGQAEQQAVPYTLMGTIADPGLGLLSWWS